MTPEKNTDGWPRIVIETIITLAVAVGLAFLVQAFLVKPYRIPTLSMAPTLGKDQRILVNRISNRFSDPQIGDITVFHPPSEARQDIIDSPFEQCAKLPPQGMACSAPGQSLLKENFVKRIVGLPGDTISISRGRVIRNARLTNEPFAKNTCSVQILCDIPKPITIPSDHYFLMGDNRGDSNDSRFWGPLPRHAIIGKTFFRYWPVKRIGMP
jgi:signal peptidase I